LGEDIHVPELLAGEYFSFGGIKLTANVDMTQDQVGLFLQAYLEPSSCPQQ
jgi:hypothetical protein